MTTFSARLAAALDAATLDALEQELEQLRRSQVVAPYLAAAEQLRTAIHAGLGASRMQLAIDDRRKSLGLAPSSGTAAAAFPRIAALVRVPHPEGAPAAPVFDGAWVGRDVEEVQRGTAEAATRLFGTPSP